MTTDDAHDAHAPASVHIETGIVIVTMTGRVTAESAMAAMDAIVAHPEYVPGMATLRDLRATTSIDAREHAARRLAAHGGKLDEIRGFHRTAIVTSQQVQFGLARMYELTAGRPTHDVQVFEGYDEAAAWLRSPSP